MTHYHGCVWIDHREAKIIGISETASDEDIVKGHADHKHIHRKADHVHLGKTGPDHAFLKEIATAIEPFKAILIVGPGTARTELAGFLTEHFPAIAKKVWGIEPMDHPTDGQLIAAVRKYFHAADRMHS